MPFEFVTLDDDCRPLRRVCWPGDDDFDREAGPGDEPPDAGLDCGPCEAVSAADVIENPDLLPF